MSIKITSDSTSDLSPALLEQYDITVLPLYVTMGEQTCRDGVDAAGGSVRLCGAHRIPAHHSGGKRGRLSRLLRPILPPA